MTRRLEVWPEPFPRMVGDQLRSEAARRFRQNVLPDTLDGWTPEALRERIWEKLGVCHHETLNLDVHTTGEIQMDGYVVKNISYQSRPGFRVTGNLYVPDGKGPFPGVLNMHGHWPQGRLAERVQERGHVLAKSGYVCLCVDAFGSGERSTVHGDFEYHGANIGFALFNLGETLMGAQIVDNMRGVDLLCSLDRVDPERIGATGASGGGNQTMWLCALDERVKAAVPVVSVGSFESYVMNTNCVCEVLPDGLTFTEESGVLALAAPRALKICNALGDSSPTFLPSEMLRSFKEARKVFQAHGADDKFSYQVFNRAHGYWPEMREAMLGWFDLWLKGEGRGAPRAEPSFETLPEERLMCFEKGRRPKALRSIAEYCQEVGIRIKSESLSQDKLDPDVKKAELRELLRSDGRRGLSEVCVHGSVDWGGRSWEKVSLATDDGRLYPLLCSAPLGRSSRYVLLLDDAGKAGALKHADLAKGDGLIVPDLSCAGELAEEDKDKTHPHHDVARAMLWLGRRFLGEWVKDIRLFADFAKRRGAKELAVAATGEASLAALFAAAVDGGFADVELAGLPLSYVFEDKPSALSCGTHLPGILKWGDVALAVALVDVPVKLLAPRKFGGGEYTASGLAAFRAEAAVYAKKLGCESSLSTVEP